MYKESCITFFLSSRGCPQMMSAFFGVFHTPWLLYQSVFLSIVNMKSWGLIKRCLQVWAADILLAVAAARHNIARHCWAPVQRKALGWSLHNVETPKPKPRLPGSAGLCGHTHVQYCLVLGMNLISRYIYIPCAGQCKSYMTNVTGKFPI